MIVAELPKSYTPAEHEDDIRARWESSNVFHAEAGADGEPYCILIPPPNVTAALHLGHAFNNTLQDVLVRCHRMRGRNVLWMPGTDHAGIATQTVVEKRLLAQGKKRVDMSRDDFVALVQQWKDEYEATITEQLKAMGCSCDWSRQRFTMDDVCAKAVREAFFQLFKDGLIYRGKRLVNWDPVTLTALADDEVEMKEVQGHMWYLHYPLADGSGHVTVATTRPETMLGDTAVAMNPNDPRAEELVGKKVKLPIVGREIEIVADDYVVLPREIGGDPADAKSEFATGFLKVTPAHDPNDWDIGQRHELDVVNIMAPDGSISSQHGWEDVSSDAEAFVGMSREDARTAIVDWFKKNDLLEKVRDYAHSVGHSYRSHVPIEPYLSDQWYVKVSDDRLVGEAQRALNDDQFDGEKPLRDGSSERTGDGDLTFYPDRYAKMYQSWHANLRDWCISRQLWWGHRIPVWTFSPDSDTTLTAEAREELGELESAGRIILRSRQDGDADSVFVCIRNVNDNDAISLIESFGLTRDPDVLDTWFSSGLWPISTLGWPDPASFPNEYPDGDALLNTFNPSAVLCTGRDIITLWVSRMVMFNRYFRNGTLPFENVYINPMIQDGHGQRMSKSLGNGVDPRDIIHGHGADALRFTLVQMATSTQDVRLPVDMTCPHCEATFPPEEITSSAGYLVAAPTQQCPKCDKKMLTLYGALTGVSEDDAKLPQARNTSRKFDLGRNFANKLWNATRFALSNITTTDHVDVELNDLAPADRWIINRLHSTLHAVEAAVEDYQFSQYAEAMYDFIWRDFCDWYLEAIKPTVKDRPAQQQVLRAVLNAALRLLHPICPFVTEALWNAVQDSGPAGLPGVDLPPSELLAAAAWPDVACSIHDKEIDKTFDRIQSLTNAIRNIRGERRVKPRKQITICVSDEIKSLINAGQSVVETLANVEMVRSIDADRPADAIPLAFEGQELLLCDLVDAVDLDAERARLQSVIDEKTKAIGGYKGRLANESYVAKAPAKLVEETRQQLAAAESDLAAAKQALESLQ